MKVAMLMLLLKWVEHKLASVTKPMTKISYSSLWP